MSDRSKITEAHRRRRAVVYVRQSTPAQLERNHESRARQYALRDRAVELGWPAGAVVVVDGDLGRSGASTDGRLGFKELVAEVGLKGTMSEAELHLIRSRLDGGLRNKAKRGELELSLPVGLDRDEDGHIVLAADEQVRHAIERV